MSDDFEADLNSLSEDDGSGQPKEPEEEAEEDVGMVTKEDVAQWKEEYARMAPGKKKNSLYQRIYGWSKKLGIPKDAPVKPAPKVETPKKRSPKKVFVDSVEEAVKEFLPAEMGEQRVPMTLTLSLEIVLKKGVLTVERK